MVSFLNCPVLTISINVHSAGVSLSITVCVCLVWVTIVGAVITAVTHVIAVVVILPGVVDEWTVVLFQKDENKRQDERFRIGFRRPWPSPFLSPPVLLLDSVMNAKIAAHTHIRTHTNTTAMAPCGELYLP